MHFEVQVRDSNRFNDALVLLFDSLWSCFRTGFRRPLILGLELVGHYGSF